MGADVVIAVDVGSPLLKREQLRSLLSVTGQVFTILTRKNAREQLAKADVVLTPPVASYGTMAFESGGEIVRAGAGYARSQQDRLAAYAVGADEYASLGDARPQRADVNRPLDYLGFEGSRRVDSRVVNARLRTQAGRPIDGELLRRDVTKIYGLDDFQEVAVSLRDVDDQYGLILDLKDKPWGPTYLRFGIRLTDDLEGDSSYHFVMSATRTRINALGAEWRSDFRIGRDLGVVSEFYQPLDFRGRYFVAPSVYFLRNTLSLYEERNRVALVDIEQRGIGLDAGMQFEDWGALRLGVFRGRADAGVDAGIFDAPDGTLHQGGVRGSIAIDRTDSPTIPRHGASIGARFASSQPRLGATSEYSKAEAGAIAVFTRGATSYLVGVSGGSDFGTDIPLYDEFGLGGLLNLGGFAEGQLHGERYAIVRAGAYRRIHLLSQQLGGGVYAGVFVETGNAWADGQMLRIDDLHQSATFLLGADTLIGPIFIGYARADTADSRFYLTIGKTFQ
jgi:NTE family protein